LPGINAQRRATISVGELTIESNDAAVRREPDARFPRIAWNERADRPAKRSNVLAADECVKRIVTTAGELDEDPERIVALEANGGSRARGSKGVSAEKRIGSGEGDVASEGLLKRDNRKGAGKEPRGGSRRDDGNRDYEDRDF
jgi:hypothetical protein